MSKALSIATLVAGVVALIATATSDTVQSFWAAHSTAAMLATLVVTKISLFLPSPAQK